VNEETLVNTFRATHPDIVVSSEVLREKRVSVVVKWEGIMEAARSLKEDFGFSHPISAGGVDYPKEEKMQIIYYLLNPDSGIMLTLRVDLPRNDLDLPSLTPIWEAMSFHEREAHEMFGFYFKGHDNLIPLLLPPDWRASGRDPPLRKDFKLGGD
jgi:NADH-quinone oxidoreductase subunit C